MTHITTPTGTGPNVNRMKRAEIGRKRNAPASSVVISIRYDSDPIIEDPDTDGGRLFREITVEATAPNGTLADWFDDVWWGEVATRWGAEEATIKLEPSPEALLHPVVLHEMEMIARAVPKWRTIGHAYVDDFFGDDDILALAKSPYDEIRIYDAPRPRSPDNRMPTGALTMAELLSQIHRKQQEINARRPALVRMPAPSRLISDDAT